MEAAERLKHELDFSGEKQLTDAEKVEIAMENQLELSDV